MNITKAAQLIIQSKETTVFTGAGISVESGIPPFRGDGGLWSHYDPDILDLIYYLSNHQKSWPVIKKLFFDFFGNSKPNLSHLILAEWEEQGLIKTVITQNIDSLHQKAGSKNVCEFHGTSESFICTKCKTEYLISELELTEKTPMCSNTICNGLLKPNFIFFGEEIPEIAYKKSLLAAQHSDVFLIIGTTGEIMPASQIPFLAKQNGCKIVEINIKPSSFTSQITDLFLQGKATEISVLLDTEIKSFLTK